MSQVNEGVLIEEVFHYSTPGLTCDCPDCTDGRL